MKKRRGDLLCLSCMVMFALLTLPFISMAEESVDMLIMENALESNTEKLNSLLDWAGYFEITYSIPSKDKRNATDTKKHYDSFQLNRLDLFLGKKIDRWRFFAQLEYGLNARNSLEAAHSSDEADCSISADNSVTITENACDKIKELEEKNAEELNLGIEAVWVEYTYSNLLGLRIGKQLTPIGWWNVNHHPITVLSTSRPPSTFSFNPHEMVGVMALGSLFYGDYGLDYKAYIINDISDTLLFEDNGGDKPVGGRLKLNAPWLDRFDIGVSIIKGKDESKDTFIKHDIWGVDEYIKIGGFEILSEYVFHEVQDSANSADQQSVNNLGYYIQPSYSFSQVSGIGKLTLFYRYDKIDKDQEHDDKTINTFGINIKPKPEIALKAEYLMHDPKDSDKNKYEEFFASLTTFF